MESTSLDLHFKSYFIILRWNNCNKIILSPRNENLCSPAVLPSCKNFLSRIGFSYGWPGVSCCASEFVIDVNYNEQTIKLRTKFFVFDMYVSIQVSFIHNQCVKLPYSGAALAVDVTKDASCYYHQSFRSHDVQNYLNLLMSSVKAATVADSPFVLSFSLEEICFEHLLFLTLYNNIISFSNVSK